MLGQNYVSYTQALDFLEQDTLENRRKMLCKKFAKRCTKNEKMKILFKRGKKRPNRKEFIEPFTKSKRAFMGPIPFLTRLLNEN